MQKSKYIFSLFFLSTVLPAQAIKNKTFNNLNALNTITANLISTQLLNTININASGNITATSLSAPTINSTIVTAPTINSTTINSTTVNSTNIIATNITGTLTGDASLDLPLNGSRAMTGTIKMPAGDVNNPSLTFTNDQTTGICQPAAHELVIATNGTDKIKVDATGTNINENLYLNCATQFTTPNGYRYIELSPPDDSLSLSDYPNTSVFFLESASGNDCNLTIYFDTNNDEGRIITFISARDSGNILISSHGTGSTLIRGDILLVPLTPSVGGLAAVSLIRYSNYWLPIWSHKIDAV